MCKDKVDTGCGCQEEKVNDEVGCCSNNPQDELQYISEEDDEDEDDDDDSYDSAYETDYDKEKVPEVMDLKDIGNAMKQSAKNSNSNKVPKEMVTAKQAKDVLWKIPCVES